MGQVGVGVSAGVIRTEAQHKKTLFRKNAFSSMFPSPKVLLTATVCGVFGLVGTAHGQTTDSTKNAIGRVQHKSFNIDFNAETNLANLTGYQYPDGTVDDNITITVEDGRQQVKGKYLSDKAAGNKVVIFFDDGVIVVKPNKNPPDAVVWAKYPGVEKEKCDVVEGSNGGLTIKINGKDAFSVVDKGKGLVISPLK